MIDVACLVYKPGWRFRVGGPGGRYLCVYAHTPDSLAATRMRWTQHQFEMPDTGGDRDWIRWFRECLIAVETHEVDEFLSVSGRRPFMPHHNDEGSAYEYVERWEDTPWH